jgi:hypothetical protein
MLHPQKSKRSFVRAVVCSSREKKKNCRVGTKIHTGRLEVRVAAQKYEISGFENECRRQKK